MLSDRRRRLSLYLGGFLGPFGTIVILPMFPELRESFSASSGAVSLGFTLYMLPFAALLLVSGTLGERWGRRRVVRASFWMYAGASMVCALAPTLSVFLVGRALQGTANAFITPLLVAGLAEMTPQNQLGRAVGIYSSFQAAGTGLAPLLGGLAAEVDWRWAFIGTAVVALGLSLAPPPGEPRRDLEAPPIRPLFSQRMIALGTAAFSAAAGPIGMAILVGVAARDELGLTSSEAGILLVGGSAAALVLGPTWGRLLDRWGGRRAGLVAIGATTLTAAALALATNSAQLALIWGVGGALAAFVVVVLHGLTATAVPENRGGALSAMLACRFLGHAAGPAIWIPVFTLSPEAAFLGSASLGIVAAIAIVAATEPTDEHHPGATVTSPPVSTG